MTPQIAIADPTPTQLLNAQLARLKVQGRFEPCPLDAECENCGCQLRGHFGHQYPGFAIRCTSCGCTAWSCRHGGGDRLPRSA